MASTAMRASSHLPGIGFMLLSTVGEAVLLSAVRYLSAEVHPFQLAFLRSFIGLLTLAPLLLWYGAGVWRTRRIAAHGLRALTNVAAMLLFFTGLAQTPLAQAQALGFSAPLFATLLAALLLGERIRRRRWLALATGFAGALIIIRPGVGAVGAGALYIVASAALWGVTMIVIKWLSRSESPLTITLYMALLMSLLALPAALPVWQWLSGWQLALITLGAVSATLGQLAMAQAFRVADVSVVLPMDFTKLIWASALGYWLFAERIDLWTLLGGGVIFMSVLYIAWRERRLRGDG